MKRGLLAGAGIVSVGLGVVGVIVPVLPTTPFILLAAGCFARSSERLYRWLLGNRVFGGYLKGYRDGEGLPEAVRMATIALLWIALGFSAFFVPAARTWWMRCILLAVGIGVSIHIFLIGARKRSKKTSLNKGRSYFQ